MLTFAIGDVHGCSDKLSRLLARIDERAGEQPTRIVCLGDYVDRGPDSAGAIATLRDRQARLGRDRFVCLKGNHEDMLLGARFDRDGEALWRANGAADCLRSFGSTHVEELPDDVVRWIESCPTVFEDSWRCFVHAGLDPARPRHDQRDEDRLWIRDAFLLRDHDFGRYVVHGHTPRTDGRPDMRPHRVNLDTAAVSGGPLTAALFVDGAERPVEFLQAF